MRKYTCGVPDHFCSAGLVQASQGMIKLHSSSEEAFNCHKKYLLSQGFIQLKGNEFRPPNGGPVRVLTRPGRFGGVYRQEKNIDGKGNRVVPKVHKQSKSGLIASH